MKSFLFVSAAAFAVVALVIGCGGGGSGGSGGGGGGGTDAPYPGQYVEFLGFNRGSNLDPLNLQLGDDIQLVLANYDPAKTRTVLNASNWSCSALSTDVALNAAGHLKVLKRPIGIFQVSCTATVSGVKKTYVQDLNVPTSTTIISGKVVAEGSNDPAKYIQVNFYDASGEAVGGSRTGDGGAFYAQVPSNAYSVSIKPETVPAPPYYKSFVYAGKVYTMDAVTCPLKLSGIVAGQNNVLPSSLALFQQVDGPPPPPDGCKP